MAHKPMMPAAHTILKEYFPGLPWIVNRSTVVGVFHINTTGLGREGFSKGVTIRLCLSSGSCLQTWEHLVTEGKFRDAVQDLQEYLHGIVAALDQAMQTAPEITP